MRTKIFMGALVALLAVACAKEQLPEQKESTAEGLAVTASVEQPGDGTKTSLDGLSVKWSVGDQIYLTNAEGTKTAIYKATTAEETTSFEKVEGDDFDEEDVIYAYYPADKVTGFSEGAFTATIPAAQYYVTDGFAEGVNPMTAKATVAGGNLSLVFKNVLSYVRMQVSGCSESQVLTGLSLTSSTALLNGTATVNVGSSGIPTISIASGSNTAEVFGLSASTASTIPIYVAVPVGNLGTLTAKAITAEATGLYSQDKAAGAELTTERRSIYRYNAMPLSAFSSNRTKIAEPAANCYMVDGSSASSISIPLYQAIAGWNAIKVLEPEDTFDKAKIVSGTRDIAVRWFDKATGTITKTDIDGNVLTLSLAPAVNGCNAVVDLKNGDEVVWSWHIWFTDYKPGADQATTQNGQVHTYSGLAFQPGGLYYGKVMMDRNLGAVATNVSETNPIDPPTSNAEGQKYLGLYYQFGRKTPFATTELLKNAEKQDITTSGVTYAYSTQNPEKFFYSQTQTDSWSSTDRNATVAVNPWGSEGRKSVFDPCPSGWRIPKNNANDSENVYKGISTEDWCDYVGTDYWTAGFFWCGAWFPGSGHRDPKGTYQTGSGCMYTWSSSPKNPTTLNGALYGRFAKTSASIGSSATRTYGFTIRCVKD